MTFSSARGGWARRRGALDQHVWVRWARSCLGRGGQGLRLSFAFSLIAYRRALLYGRRGGIGSQRVVFGRFGVLVFWVVAFQYCFGRGVGFGYGIFYVAIPWQSILILASLYTPGSISRGRFVEMCCKLTLSRLLQVTIDVNGVEEPVALRLSGVLVLRSRSHAERWPAPCRALACPGTKGAKGKSDAHFPATKWHFPRCDRSCSIQTDFAKVGTLSTLRTVTSQARPGGAWNGY